jgi:hypothetical protein
MDLVNKSAQEHEKCVTDVEYFASKYCKPASQSDSPQKQKYTILTKNSDENVANLLSVITEMYADKKLHNFVLHLVRAYALENSISKVNAFIPGQHHRCSISNKKLICIKFAKEKHNIRNTVINEDVYSDNLRAALKEDELAFTGVDTKTVLCYDAIIAIKTWVAMKFATNDANVQYAIKAELKKRNPHAKQGKQQKQNSSKHEHTLQSMLSDEQVRKLKTNG